MRACKVAQVGLELMASPLQAPRHVAGATADPSIYFISNSYF